MSPRISSQPGTPSTTAPTSSPTSTTSSRYRTWRFDCGTSSGRNTSPRSPCRRSSSGAATTRSATFRRPPRCTRRSQARSWCCSTTAATGRSTNRPSATTRSASSSSPSTRYPGEREECSGAEPRSANEGGPVSGELMRAVRIHAWGAAPTLDEVPAPAARDGETLVRVEAAAVAHLDLTVASGNFRLKPQLPYIGGVEGCGTVVSSETYEPGTRVVLRGGGLGLVRSGTWAELVATRKGATPIPAELSPELGATYFVPTTTAYVALHDIGRLGNWPGI